jgi:hypothetical protein
MPDIEPGSTPTVASEISLSDVDAGVPAGAQFDEIPRTVLGYLIFKWLLLLIGILLGLLTVYGVLSYPSISDARSLAGASGDAGVILQQAKAEWVSSIKDLGQIFLITPVLPLLGAVLGYIFGRHEQASPSNSD